MAITSVNGVNVQHHQYSVGLNNVGSYQVSGMPFVSGNLDSSSGVVNIGLSNVGTYTIEYTTANICSSVSSKVIVINPMEDSSFSYTKSIICQTNSNLIVPTSTTISGTYNSNPSGLNIDSITGAILPCFALAVKFVQKLVITLSN